MNSSLTSALDLSADSCLCAWGLLVLCCILQFLLFWCLVTHMLVNTNIPGMLSRSLLWGDRTVLYESNWCQLFILNTDQQSFQFNFRSGENWVFPYCLFVLWPFIYLFFSNSLYYVQVFFLDEGLLWCYLKLFMRTVYHILSKLMLLLLDLL